MDISGLTTEAAFAQIDCEISHLEKRLWTLRSLRNTLPPISFLPNEILSRIFLITHTMNVETGSAGGLGVTSERRGKTRLVLSWVSQRWREVAISYPELWTLVINGNMDYIRACIHRRSKGFQLMVILHSPGVEHVRECLPAMGRVRSLEANLSWTMHPEDIDRIWEEPAPNLVSLLVRHINLDRREHGNQTPVSSTIHPRLQHLTIDSCEFQWDSPFISSTLTTLHITSPKLCLAAGALADTLWMMPRLIECKLTWCLSGNAGSLSTRQVYLPNLQILILEQSPIKYLFVFLSYLNIPNCSLDIRARANWVEDTNHGFANYWNQTPYWKDEELRYISVSSSSPNFNISLSTSPPGTPMQRGARQFTMSIGLDLVEETLLSALSRYFSFPKCKLQGVFLKSVSRKVVYHFARFTNPLVLRLENIQRPEGNGVWLSQSDRHGADEQLSPGCLFPQLQELVVDGERYGSFVEYHSLLVRPGEDITV
ncbi:hypothetical protein BDN72DRAFT_847994 [Pluteus cervinus]|uniref:Uncharacterized protein n=1 Tax=Pluteus cervinus TaxID=181527 RepID=A0ACD3ABK4_9AGAR|nr:hypothetical protein BDN72DRAFT_847994 [Pluteus cervinus]